MFPFEPCQLLATWLGQVTYTFCALAIRWGSQGHCFQTLAAVFLILACFYHLASWHLLLNFILRILGDFNMHLDDFFFFQNFDFLIPWLLLPQIPCFLPYLRCPFCGHILDLVFNNCTCAISLIHSQESHFVNRLSSSYCQEQSSCPNSRTSPLILLTFLSPSPSSCTHFCPFSAYIHVVCH